MACPKRELLKGLVDGTLPEADAAELQEHLSTCEPCQVAILETAADPRFRAVAVEHLSEAPLDAAVVEVVETLKDHYTTGRSGRSPSTSKSDTLSLNFLLPSSDPKSLGRLGHYEITDLLGQGGMGIVFKGFDTHLKRDVAVKVLSPHLAADEAARQRFVREAEAAAAIKSEYVATVHAIDQENNPPFMVIEFVEGESLLQRIKRRKTLSLVEILRIGAETASGLSAAHECGVIHRDVKPGNILLEKKSGRAKITDFGLARVLDSAQISQSGVVIGTPQFMAPEQARGEPVDHRADLFSLGSVLYVLCTGVTPFSGDSSVHILREVSEKLAPPVQDINPQTPKRLVAVIEKLHAKDPAERSQSADEVAQELRQLLNQVEQRTLTKGVAPATPMPQPAKAASPPRRKRWKRFALVAGILFGMVIISDATGVTGISNSVLTVLRIQSQDGTVVVEVHDPAVRVSVEGDDIGIKGAGIHELHLRPGRHKLLFERDGQRVKSEWVTVSRNGRTVVRLGYEGQGKTRDAAGAPVSTSGKGGETFERELAKQWPVGEVRKYKLERPQSVAFALGGRHVLAGSWERKIEIWGTRTGARIQRLLPSDPYILSIAATPDGRRLVAGLRHNHAVSVWNVASGKEEYLFKEHGGGVSSVDISEDARLAVSASSDQTVRVWDLEAGEQRRSYPISDATCVCFVDGSDRFVVVTRRGTIEYLSADSAEPIRRIHCQGNVGIGSVDVLNNAPECLVGNDQGKVELWDLETGEQLQQLSGHAAAVTSVAVSENNRFALTGSKDSTIRLWDLKTGKQISQLNGHGKAPVTDVAISPEGFLGVSCGQDNTVRLWRLPVDKKAAAN